MKARQGDQRRGLILQPYRRFGFGFDPDSSLRSSSAKRLDLAESRSCVEPFGFADLSDAEVARVDHLELSDAVVARVDHPEFPSESISEDDVLVADLGEAPVFGFV